MTTKNDIPAGALYIEDPERITRPNDHLTIEGRLARLEARTDRLEAWTRHELFARTAMDEPDEESEPEPDDAAKWQALSDFVAIECHINSHSTWGQTARNVVARAIDLGLASPAGWIDPATVGPIECDDETLGRIVRGVMQDFGISTPTSWDHLSESRKQPHIVAGRSPTVPSRTMRPNDNLHPESRAIADHWNTMPDLIERLAEKAEAKHIRDERVRKIDPQPQPRKTFQMFAVYHDEQDG